MHVRIAVIDVVSSGSHKRLTAMAGSECSCLTPSGVAAPRVLLARAPDDFGRQARPGRTLVPVERLEVVAHELLVEARRAASRRVGIRRPEARRVGRQRLVDQRQRAALVDAELELRVGDDDAARRARGRRRTGTARVAVSRTCSASAGPSSASTCVEADVLVVLARTGLGRRREDRLRQPVRDAAVPRAARCRTPRRCAGSPSSPSRSGSRARPPRPAAPCSWRTTTLRSVEQRALGRVRHGACRAAPSTR